MLNKERGEVKERGKRGKVKGRKEGENKKEGKVKERGKRGGK